MSNNRKAGNYKLRSMILAAIFAALLTVISQLAFLLGPIPITLQLIVIWLAGGLLGSAWGSISVSIWLAMAVIGLPVLAGGNGGILAVFGPRVGFLLGFIICAGITGMAGWRSGYWRQATFMLLGLVAVYVMGVAGLWVYNNWLVSDVFPLRLAIQTGVWPFLIADILKLLLTAVIIINVKRILIARNFY